MILPITASITVLALYPFDGTLQLTNASNDFHPFRAPREIVLLVEDSDTQINQIPLNRVGPAGNRIPEVGPPPPKTEGSAVPAKPNTANCTGANASDPACYTATQQTKGK